MRNLFTRRRVAVGAVAAALLVGGGTVFAWWSTSGSGSGTASTATAQSTTALTFSQNALTAMFPGDTSQTLTVTVTNTGSQNAYVASVSAYLTVAQTVAGALAGPCGAGDYLLGGVAASGDAAAPDSLTWTAADLAKSGGHANATSTIQFNDTGSDQDGCQGATVTLHYSAK